MRFDPATTFRSSVRMTDSNMVTEPQSPETLITLIATQRDRQAYAALFTRFAPKVKGFVMAQGLTAQEAEDLAQDALLNVWRKAEMFDPAKATAATWIYSIARNLRIDLARKAKRVKTLPEDLWLSENDKPADDMMADAQSAKSISHILSTLPEEQKNDSAFVILRRYVAWRYCENPVYSSGHSKITDASGHEPDARRHGRTRRRRRLMNPVTHHPGEDLLWDYYRGVLAPGQSMAVNAHLDSCAHCRGDMKLFDLIGSAMLDEVEGVEMSETALDLALARIERPEPVADVAAKPLVKRPAFLEGFELPETLKRAVVKPRRWVAPGVWLAPVELAEAQKTSRTYLLHVPAGMTMPEHTHKGLEMTVVLKGRFSDNKGEFGVGDFCALDSSDSHSPGNASADESCLCLITTEMPIVPKTVLGWLLKPVARI